MRVLTINVQNDEGDPRRTHLLNRELRRLRPDLVVFQEVCYPDRRDQLAELIDGTGLHATHQAGVLDHRPPGAERYGGTAVATRWPHRICEVREGRMADAPDLYWWTLAVAVEVPGLGEQLVIAPTTPWPLDAERARVRARPSGGKGANPPRATGGRPPGGRDLAQRPRGRPGRPRCRRCRRAAAVESRGWATICTRSAA